MIINNKLDKCFGPIGSQAGMFVIFLSLIITWFNWLGILPLIVGVLVGFSYTSTSIDIGNKRVRYINNYFGFIKSGKWINIESDMLIGIKKSDIVWEAHSRSNRTFGIEDKDFRVLLCNAHHKEIMELKKSNTFDNAKQFAHLLKDELGLGII